MVSLNKGHAVIYKISITSFYSFFYHYWHAAGKIDI